MLCAQIIAAQTDTTTLSLDDAIRIALSESPTVKVADKEIQRVDYAQKAAWYGILPSLSASAQGSKYLAPATMNIAGMVIKLSTDYIANAQLNLGLPLFAPGLWKSIQMTKLDMQLAVEKAHASKLGLRNQVTKAYYNVLLAQDSYKTLQQGYSLAEESYKQAQKRFEAGISAEYDAISAKVQMQNLQPNLLLTENAIEQAKMYLKILMGVDASMPMAIIGSLAEYESGIMDNNSLQLLSASENSNIKQLDIQKMQLNKALQMQQTLRMPTLAAFGNFTYEGTSNKAGENPFTHQPTPASSSWYSKGLIAGLQLSVPLSAIFTNTAAEKQTKIQIEELEIQRDYLKNSIDEQVRVAQNSMDVAAKQIQAAKDNETLAQKGYNISSKRYETGMGTILELQNAALQVTQTQLAHRQAVANYLSAKADLELLIGKTN